MRDARIDPSGDDVTSRHTVQTVAAAVATQSCPEKTTRFRRMCVCVCVSMRWGARRQRVVESDAGFYKGGGGSVGMADGRIEP